jgi:hypothetical protein
MEIFSEAFTLIEPPLPGPSVPLLMAAPSLKLSEPVVMKMLPPGPESGRVPMVRLCIPAGEPSLNIPEIEIVFPALIVMPPPAPVLLVPLLIWAPSPMIKDPVMTFTFPASPQDPEQESPIVCVKIPLGVITPRENNGSGEKLPVSPDIAIISVELIVTFPLLPLLRVTELIRAPPVISRVGVVIRMFPEFPNVPRFPNELLKIPLGLSPKLDPNNPKRSVAAIEIEPAWPSPPVDETTVLPEVSSITLPEILMSPP